MVLISNGFTSLMPVFKRHCWSEERDALSSFPSLERISFEYWILVRTGKSKSKNREMQINAKIAIPIRFFIGDKLRNQAFDFLKKREICGLISGTRFGASIISTEFFDRFR